MDRSSFLPSHSRGVNSGSFRDGYGAHSSRDGHGAHSSRDGHGALSSRDGHGALSSRDGHGSLSSRDGYGAHSSRDGNVTLSFRDGRGSLSSMDVQDARYRTSLSNTRNPETMRTGDIIRPGQRTESDHTPQHRVVHPVHSGEHGVHPEHRDQHLYAKGGGVEGAGAGLDQRRKAGERGPGHEDMVIIHDKNLLPAVS